MEGTIAGLLICCTGLAFFTGFLLKKFIKEPIAILGKIAESYSRGDYHPEMNVIPYREFKTVVAVLIKMGDTIEAQMNELKKAEASLRKHRDSLEEAIAKRTVELEASNQKLHHEIQHRKQTQEALRMNEQRLDAILRSSPVGIGLVVEERLDWANETLYLMVGYDEAELLHRDIGILFQEPDEHERYLKTLTRSISKSSPNSMETQWVRKDGTVFDCIVRVYPHDIDDPSKGRIVAVADISDRKASEHAVREKDRLQGVLELSGAVSHEMNQPLMSALGYIDLLQMNMREDDPNMQGIEKIKIQLDRMTDITKKLVEISDYQTKDYLGGQIVDLSKSADPDSGEG